MSAFRILTTLAFLSLAMGIAVAQDEPTSAEVSLEVTEMSFGTDYDRETHSLVGTATTFPAGVERLWCRTRILGAAEPVTITHVWYRDGKTMARVELDVRSSDWRTVSSKLLLPDWTGRWEVKVLDAAGTILRAESVTVE